MNPRAEIICIGSELLAGKSNTHVPYLTPLLRAAGLNVPREATLDDTHSEIERAVASAAIRSDVVLVCGGLGPTFDDVTREAVAGALGRPLSYNPALFKKIRRKFKRYEMTVPSNNKRQAWVLRGAKVLDNHRGSAPGQIIDLGGKPARSVILLPGPFHELKNMFEADVLPLLRRRFGAKHAHRRRVFHFCGIAEAAADRLLRPLIRKPGPGLGFTILSGLGHVRLDVAVTARSLSEASRRLAKVDKRVRTTMKKYIYGTDDDSLASVVGKRLRRRRWKLATAESCTGGLLAARLTSVPGSSKFFAGGIVAYHNSVKSSLLEVAGETLQRDGAVSARTAKEMAKGACARLGAQAAVSITGIAGPSGGSPRKPVGLTYIGVSLPGSGSKKAKNTVFRFHFPGTRRQIRERAANTALLLLWRLLPI